MADHTSNLDEGEQREVEENSAPAAKVVHAVVSKQGAEEMERPLASLFCSATAAGVAIMASLSVSGALHHSLPDAPWRELIAALGYPVGFLVVVLGRMQLFTEQTVVTILPLAREPTMRNFIRVVQLWILVFVGNVTGAACVSALCAFGHVQSPEVQAGMIDVSAKLLERDAVQTLLQAIPAGFLMAALAWVRAAEDHMSFWIVLALTLAIGLCGFAHVVAGSTEAWLLLWTGRTTLAWVLGGFMLPALIGNVIGGTGLFAVLAHAQVRSEI
ncbi:formate/nitrite transporter family protein [Novosphingobium aquimarinum]|uniref:formate/nitrite transporter family protein n=1 Tax=Novosphingobium aquimarinum TaxID=2682494 RepID=UPI0018DB7286|nr:formate/nitrite transporter family protein [Novosphingobium aquimarinum]